MSSSDGYRDCRFFAVSVVQAGYGLGVVCRSYSRASASECLKPRRGCSQRCSGSPRRSGYSVAGAFLYQLVITPTRWTMFCVRMIGAKASGSKSLWASVVRQMLDSVTGAAM